MNIAKADSQGYEQNCSTFENVAFYYKKSINQILPNIKQKAWFEIVSYVKFTYSHNSSRIEYQQQQLGYNFEKKLIESILKELAIGFASVNVAIKQSGFITKFQIVL